MHPMSKPHRTRRSLRQWFGSTVWPWSRITVLEDDVSMLRADLRNTQEINRNLDERCRRLTLELRSREPELRHLPREDYR